MNRIKVANELVKIAKSLTAGSFWRLPKKVVANEMFLASKALSSMSEWLNEGNDFKPDDLDQIIKKLEAAKKSAKKFNSAEEVEDEYK